MKKILLLLSLVISAPSYTVNFQDIIHYFFAKKEVEQPVMPIVAIMHIDDKILENFNDVLKNLHVIASDNTIHGMILIVNSGGGSSPGFSCIHDMLKKVAEKKPLVALVTSQATSGGYLVASVANYIYAHSLSDIGHIGSILQVNRYHNPKYKDDQIEADLDVAFFSSGRFKSIYSPFEKELSGEEKAYLQMRSDQSYEEFVTMVAQNRNLKRDDQEKWAEAKIFDAKRAKEMGLIDGIGTIIEAETKMVDLIRENDPTTLYDNDIISVNFSAQATSN